MNFSIDYLIDKVLNGGGDIDAHVLTLFSIALSIKAKTILELGVRFGNSTVPLLMATQKLEGKLYSVDINDVETDFSILEELKPYWEFHKCDTIEFLYKWDQNNKIDLILIDDLHTYEHVKKELELLEKLITPSSIILLHDSMYYGTCPNYNLAYTEDCRWKHGGPARAVLELDMNIWEFSTIPVCNGLTILRKKGD
jgi:predicted O-methyltransferase YrrM